MILFNISYYFTYQFEIIIFSTFFFICMIVDDANTQSSSELTEYHRFKKQKKTKRTPFLELSFKETPYDDIPMIIAEHDCSTPENLAILRRFRNGVIKMIREEYNHPPGKIRYAVSYFRTDRGNSIYYNDNGVISSNYYPLGHALITAELVPVMPDEFCYFRINDYNSNPVQLPVSVRPNASSYFRINGFGSNQVHIEPVPINDVPEDDFERRRQGIIYTKQTRQLYSMVHFEDDQVFSSKSQFF